MAFAHALHSRANRAPARFAIMLPHQLASQPFWSVQHTLLHGFLATIRPFSREFLSEVDVLNEEQNWFCYEVRSNMTLEQRNCFSKSRHDFCSKLSKGVALRK